MMPKTVVTRHRAVVKAPATTTSRRRPRGPFAPVEEAVEAIRAGRMVIVVDDEDRENEGDLTIAAEKVTPEVINFMMTHGRGLICMPMTAERLDALEVPLQVPAGRNTTAFDTAFCVGIDARRRQLRFVKQVSIFPGEMWIGEQQGVVAGRTLWRDGPGVRSALGF